MAVNIDQVLDYLDDHLVCRCAGSMESLLGMMHEVYGKHNRIDREQIRSMLGESGSPLDTLSSEDARNLMSAICNLLDSFEQRAFSQGVLVGMQLMTEINWLP